MKKISKISLHQLDRAELSKKQQGLLFGGGDPGWCKCGSCATPSGGSPSTAENEAANKENGYTITGSNDPVFAKVVKVVLCKLFQNSEMA